MKRTMRRPLPSGRISIPHAVSWASTAGVAGTALLAWKVDNYFTNFSHFSYLLKDESLASLFNIHLSNLKFLP